MTERIKRKEYIATIVIDTSLSASRKRKERKAGLTIRAIISA